MNLNGIFWANSDLAVVMFCLITLCFFLYFGLTGHKGRSLLNEPLAGLYSIVRGFPALCKCQLGQLAWDILLVNSVPH